MGMVMFSVLSFIALFICVTGVTGITNTNGGYEDINVIIQDSVEENETLIAKIQDIFTNASQLLFQATKQHVYFGKINIILPKTWTPKPEYTVMPARSEFETYITVEEGRIKRPHTKPWRQKCGVQMRYIYLPTRFLLTEGKTEWGYHANVLVHEWCHLRWGLFDEYSTEKTGQFYMKDGVWKPSRCSENVTGAVGRGSDCSEQTNCDHSNTEHSLHEDCKFCPNESQTGANLASVMAYNWVDAVSMFCDNPDDASVPINQRHNRDARNKQNKQCKHRSAWEVMRDHEDFQSAPLSDTTVKAPEFEILQESDCYRVFVLDVSGSMKAPRITYLYDSSKLLIETMIGDDSWLGVISFNESARITTNLTKVTSASIRSDIIHALPTTTDGSTCIGCGIEEALTMLSSGMAIILVSDGFNNVGDLDASIQMAIDKQVIIHTVAVTQNADSRLQTMSAATGGSYTAYLESTTTVTLLSTFMALLQCGATSYARDSTTLLSETLGTSESTEVNFTFHIDDSIGQNTTISVLLNDTTDVQLEVVDPNGSVHIDQTDGKSISLVLPDTATPGQYAVTVRTSSSSTFEYYVTSLPSELEVFRVIPGVYPTALDFKATGELPVVYADVIKGRAPILNANVTVVVDTGLKSCDITLQDDGADPDAFYDDGVYSGVIPIDCLIDGRIVIKVYARGESGTSRILNDVSGAGAPDSDEDTNITDVLETSFQRAAIANEIQVTNVVDQDIVAPGQITNVNIIDVVAENSNSSERRNFTITWTATGDDMNLGQAAEYELRIADRQNDVLLDEFYSANQQVLAMFTPKAAGTTETALIVVDSEDSPYTSTAYFAVRVKDESGNVGAISNIVSIVVAKGYRIQIEADGRVISTFTDTSDEMEKGNDGKLIGISVGLSTLGALVLIVLIFCFVKKFKAKAAVGDSVFANGTSLTEVTAMDTQSDDFLQTIATRRTPARTTSTFELTTELNKIPELTRNDEDTNITDVLETSFQRAAIANEIQVTNVVDQDIVAPGQITNVNIIDVVAENSNSSERRNFTITWTATGDDMNLGQAAEYELRIADRQNDVLLDEFYSANQQVLAMFTPKAAGTTETALIVVDSEDSPYTSTAYFAVRVKDESGNVGAISNIVSIVVAKGYRIQIEADGRVISTFTDTSDEMEKGNDGKLIGISVGLSTLGALVLIVLIFCFVKKFKAKAAVGDSVFANGTSLTEVTAMDTQSDDFLQTIATRRTPARTTSTFELTTELNKIPELTRNGTV